MQRHVTMEKLTSLCKRRGFIFAGSEIYGGLANAWDYGPYGSQLRLNIKNSWWKYCIQDRADMYGIDAAILMNPKVWEASGHVSTFHDPLVDCKSCKGRFRADHLVADYRNFDFSKMACPTCGKNTLTEPRQFNMMFRTFVGPMQDSASQVYLRPETAQGIFVNFKNVMQTMRPKIPFGIGQIGKSFRNEITPGNFIFRTLEMEQMEIEYFVHEDQWKDAFESWRTTLHSWGEKIGIDMQRVHDVEIAPNELAHYSKRTIDIEFEFPFGQKELWGLAYRTNFDLSQHQLHSGENLEYQDPVTNEKFIPHVVEPALGVDRTLLALLVSAYHEEEAPTADGQTDTRVVMRFAKEIAPVKIAVLPLSKKSELQKLSQEVLGTLQSRWSVEYDETQSIGKRYRRQDEIGTPYCVTIDFDSANDNAVTIRDRDSMKQERIAIPQLLSYFSSQLP